MTDTADKRIADQHDATTERGHPRRWAILAVMSLGTLIVFLDTTVINTALPSVARDLRASTSELQWTIDAYVLVLAGLLMLGGSLGDRFGRRRWMIIGLIIFGGASVLGGLADSIGEVILSRGLQGLGAALVLPATLSIITNVFPRRERALAIAIWTGVGGMAIGLGPAIGGWFVREYDWSAAFWIHVPVAAVGLMGMAIVPESRDSRAVGLDLPGAILGTVGISALVYGIIQGGESGWTATGNLIAFAIAAVTLTAFVKVETTSSHPMLPLHFFRHRDFSGAVAILGLMFFAGIVTFFFLTQFFQIVQGRDPFETGLLILPNAGAIVAATGIASMGMKTVGPRRMLILSTLIMAAALIWFSQLDVTTSTAVIVINVTLFGFGFGLGATPLTDTVMAAVPVEDAGIGSAVNDVSRELGGALGVAIIGSFVSSQYRSEVRDQLAGRVPDDVQHAAEEGVGVLATVAGDLPTEVASTAVPIATEAFMDAMLSGFWLSTGFMAVAVALSAWLLPDRMRAEQVERDPSPSYRSELALPAPVDEVVLVS